MPAASLERRIAAVEASLPESCGRMVVYVCGMARAGYVWLPDAFSLPGGLRVDRLEAERQDAFQARVRVAALAASIAPVVLVVAVAGREVPEALVERWHDAAAKETD